MSAQVAATDQLSLSVNGGREIFYAGSVMADDLDHVLLGSLEGSSSASLASLRSAASSLFRRHFGRKIPWAKDKWNKERYWIGLVRSESDLQRLQVEDEGQWTWGNRKVPPTIPAIWFEEKQLYVRVVVRSHEEPDLTEVDRLLHPFLEWRSAGSKIAIDDDLPEEEGRGFDLVVDIEPSLRRGATLGELWNLGDEALALLRASKGDELPRSAVLDLLSGARWDLFKGQSETEWLEAKGEPYDHLEKKLGEQNWRYELAKDVASFANTSQGGLIVLGMFTQDQGNGDVIQGHKEFDLRRVAVSTYRKHVAQLVYPQIEGFEVRRIAGFKKGWGLAVLVIPPQPKHNRPFLVQGMISDQKVHGAHVLLPTRRGDDTTLMKSEAIHTLLRLGEQVIEGKTALPSPD